MPAAQLASQGEAALRQYRRCAPIGFAWGRQSRLPMRRMSKPVKTAEAHLAERHHAPHTVAAEHAGFNGWLAVTITNLVGTMWCAYAFTALTLVSLPEAIHGGIATLIAWIAQTFLQLVLLSIIMVGQKVQAAASDKQAFQTYRDAEALLRLSAEIHQLLESNVRLTRQIHTLIAEQRAGAPRAGAAIVSKPKRPQTKKT